MLFVFVIRIDTRILPRFRVEGIGPLSWCGFLVGFDLPWICNLDAKGFAVLYFLLLELLIAANDS